jgi:Domain of unknown function (DUF1707)
MANADGKSPEVRVSDAERDAVVAELGGHFQDGRLDQAEFGDRIGAAMAARTRRDLDVLLTDLPRPAAAGSGPASQGRPVRRPGGPPRPLLLVPLAVAAVVITGPLSGGWQHGWAGWPFAPFGFAWLIIGLVAVRAWIRAGRRRQWR